MARAPLVTFLDDDNRWAPDHLQSLADCLRAHACPAAHSWLTLHHPDGRPWLEPRSPWTRGPAAAEEYDRLVGLGVFEPGSNVVRDRMDPEGHPDPVRTVDMGAWLFERELLLRIPFVAEYGPSDWERRQTEDDKLIEALVRERVPVATTRKPTLRYFLGGYSNADDSQWERPALEGGPRAPRFGIAEWCLDRVGPAAVTRAAVLGFTALHMDFSGLKGSCSEVAVAARRAGVSITAVAVNALNNLPLGDARAEERCRTSIDGAILTAVALGAGLVILPSFEAGAVHGAAGLEALVGRLARACRSAARWPKLHIATENTLGARDNLALAERVGHPALRVLVDTQNPVLFGHDPVEIAALGPLVAADAHVKDGRDGVMGNAALGAGTAAVGRTIEALRGGEVTNWILENEYADVAAGAAADLRALAGMVPA